MSLIPSILSGYLCVAVSLALVWLRQLKTRNAGMVDPVWSWSLGFLGVWFAVFGSAPPSVRLVLAVLSGLWGLRLGTHLFVRNHGHPEDGRYARLREEWGGKANVYMFAFFQVQALFSIALALAFIVVAYRSTAPSTGALVLAALVWLFAVSGEALADWQLEQFKRNPANKGRVCRDGLWFYSRHPNYFFECLHWMAYVPLAFGGAWWALSLIPPAVMAFLLLKMSGIPVTEAQSARSRPGYAEYIRTTSAFVPWPPKKS